MSTRLLTVPSHHQLLTVHPHRAPVWGLASWVPQPANVVQPQRTSGVCSTKSQSAGSQKWVSSGIWDALRLVVVHDGDIGMLQQGVDAQHGVVRLHLMASGWIHAEASADHDKVGGRTQKTKEPKMAASHDLTHLSSGDPNNGSGHLWAGPHLMTALPVHHESRAILHHTLRPKQTSAIPCVCRGGQ